MSQTVLVVDDSPTLVKFVSFSLRASGYNVLGACDGMDALEKLANLESDIDMVITDLNMPNMDGYELIATLRENDKFAATPIIILSSEEDEEDKRKGEEAGATSYLVKPFKSSVLMSEVSRLLG
ncbi:MAG: response regulator [candidate division Zixibacteria bacterium]|nr:response regulator [candidate division Zixibacteria bacterium]